jgi:hypothetical protein
MTAILDSDGGALQMDSGNYFAVWHLPRQAVEGTMTYASRQARL